LTAAAGSEFLSVGAEAESDQLARLAAWRSDRDEDAVAAALAGLEAAASAGDNVMEPSIACAHAGVTTGEWAGCLRGVFGEYRAPTGVTTEGGRRNDVGDLAGLCAQVEGLTETLGRRPKLLIGKPGLDGHSSGAEQIAVRARDAGFEVVYQGIRLTPEALVRAAQEEDVNLVGLSVLSGSHLPLVTEVIAGLAAAGLARVPVVVGGIIPPEDAEALKQAGAAAVYTPKDYELNAILEEIVEIVAKATE
jgi:(2R)-ethylmalonyl-CoA mutase